MAKFPVDAPLDRIIAALSALGFVVVRRANHVSLARSNPDGTRSTLTLPGHKVLKSSTLRAALLQAGISREDFVRAYEAS
ncbi:type II toxin-antitoxin system HicA family toxin [Acidobacteria bacterium ACD]|nr:MAG: type II toxin-antitoxin system HicA family toxin [Acidobacteriota bacterium]MCE7956746.1 type II toxin-antitoxin system HicA family toxin [Acidobacteria bacterium ACB2]MDL1949834.1 type II toxin-antitoxin system HicA family toxin [Acidobacteria bacterium ACD]